MIRETDAPKYISVTLWGTVRRDSPDGEPLGKVLIGESSGNTASTDGDGVFKITVNVEEDSQTFALCAVDQDLHVWVDWLILTPELIKKGLNICIPTAAISWPGYVKGKVTDCATGAGIQATVQIDGKAERNTTARGRYGPCTVKTGWHKLTARASGKNPQDKYFEVKTVGERVICDICL